MSAKSDLHDPSDSDRAASLVAKAGIERILLPTPFDKSGVSCWLVRDDPLTLVDVGVNWATAMHELEAALAERRLRIEDLERIIITHQHVDHSGLLGIVAERSGAETVGVEPLGPWLDSYAEQRVLDDRYRVNMLSRHGLPADLATLLGAVNRIASHWGGAAQITREIADGDVIEFAGRSLTVLERPGHSPTDTVFFDAEREMLIAGDHVMPNAASIPSITRPLRSDEPEILPQGLPTYLRSVELTRAMELSALLPGHGDVFADHRSVILSHERTMRLRMNQVRAILSTKPATAFEVNCSLNEKTAVRYVEAMMSDTLGLLSVLSASGRVSFDADETPIMFRAKGW
jgi:glyoxylase-like metal-dependent hydrolase (beta-lactamase superfamily II)